VKPVVALLGLASCLVASTRALAQSGDYPLAAEGSTVALRQGLDGAGPYWQHSGADRWFLAGTLDAATVSYRPGLAVGYGRPHWRWFGAEGSAQLSLSGVGSYLGLRGVFPYLEIKVGGRYFASINQRMLRPRQHYERSSLESEELGRSRYFASEAELHSRAELPFGAAFAVASAFAIAGVPEGQFVFEEALRVVVEPPLLYRVRGGYFAHLASDRSLKLGVAAEVIGIPRREATIVRAGPVMNLAITDHVEASAAVLVVAHSPDALGLVGADLGQIGLRYRWATGDRFPEWP
jgi:hypothetical protein